LLDGEAVVATRTLICGRGKIVVSTLDICGALDDTGSTAEEARKILCNYIRLFLGDGRSR
jgi:hypothetical protein